MRTEFDRKSEGSLSELVAGTIGRRIVSGTYDPGDTLPTEPQIQAEFGVSRTAVREAIRMLSAKGLTVSRPKIGTRVRPRVDWAMLDPEVLRWHVDQNPGDDFIHALFEMREIIVPEQALFGTACTDAGDHRGVVPLVRIDNAIRQAGNQRR